MKIKALFLKSYSKYIWITLMLMAWELTAKLTPVSSLAFPSLELIFTALTRISSNGVCRPQKYSIPRFFSVTTFSHSLRFSGV